MTSQVTPAELDLACTAAKPLVDADIAKGEQAAGIFAKRIDQAIQAHRAEINAYVRDLIRVGAEAILKSRAG